MNIPPRGAFKRPFCIRSNGRICGAHHHSEHVLVQVGSNTECAMDAFHATGFDIPAFSAELALSHISTFTEARMLSERLRLTNDMVLLFTLERTRASNGTPIFLAVLCNRLVLFMLLFLL